MTAETFQKANEILDDIAKLEQIQRESVLIQMALNTMPQIQIIRHIDEKQADNLVKSFLDDINFTVAMLKRRKIADFEKLGV